MARLREITQCCVSVKDRLVSAMNHEISNPFRRWDNSSSSHCDDNVCYAFSNFIGKFTMKNKLVL